MQRLNEYRFVISTNSLFPFFKLDLRATNYSLCSQSQSDFPPFHGNSFSSHIFCFFLLCIKKTFQSFLIALSLPNCWVDPESYSHLRTVYNTGAQIHLIAFYSICKLIIKRGINALFCVRYYTYSKGSLQYKCTSISTCFIIYL
jgi:hypothetical protein